MPRTCLACSSPEREAIDKALVIGEPLRNIAKRVSSISPGRITTPQEPRCSGHRESEPEPGRASWRQPA